jgi:hypothetical protein
MQDPQTSLLEELRATRDHLKSLENEVRSADAR